MKPKAAETRALKKEALRFSHDSSLPGDGIRDGEVERDGDGDGAGAGGGLEEGGVKKGRSEDQKLAVSNERFMVPELLFHPPDLGR